MTRDITDIRIDRQRERKFGAIVRVALGKHDDVADTMSISPGTLLVTLKSGETFELLVVNRTGREREG